MFQNWNVEGANARMRDMDRAYLRAANITVDPLPTTYVGKNHRPYPYDTRDRKSKGCADATNTAIQICPRTGKSLWQLLKWAVEEAIIPRIKALEAESRQEWLAEQVNSDGEDEDGSIEGEGGSFEGEDDEFEDVDE